MVLVCIICCKIPVQHFHQDFWAWWRPVAKQAGREGLRNQKRFFSPDTRKADIHDKHVR